MEQSATLAFQAILVFVVFLAQIAIGTLVFILWKKSTSKPDTNLAAENRLLDELRDNFNRTSSKLEVIDNRLLDKVESIKDLIHYTSFFPERREGMREAVVKTKGEWENERDESTVDRTPRVNITPRVRIDSLETRLQDLLSGSEFLQTFWPNKMSKGVDECQRELIKFLADHGLPEPEFEAYPPLQDNNPHHWHFLIVQTHGATQDKKRFVIPRHYDRFDPLWHSHLFQVRGSNNKPENFILELLRCAILNSGSELSGYIDKSRVEKQGIISLV